MSHEPYSVGAEYLTNTCDSSEGSRYYRGCRDATQVEGNETYSRSLRLSTTVIDNLRHETYALVIVRGS